MATQIQMQLKQPRSHQRGLLRLSVLSTLGLNVGAVLCVAPAIASQPESTPSVTEVKPSVTLAQTSATSNGSNTIVTVHGSQDKVTTSATDLSPVERTLSSTPLPGSPAANLSAMPTQPVPTSTWLAGITAAPAFVNSSSLEVAQESGDSAPSPTPAESPTQPSGMPSETPTTEPTETPSTQPTQSSPAQASNKWHFLFTPYVYLPITIYGDATVKGFTSNVTLPPSEVFSAIRNTFQFGLTGKLEGWSPNYRFGVLLNGDYVNLAKNNNFTRPNPDRLLDLAINRVANRLRDRFGDGIGGRLDDTLRQQIRDYLLGRLDGQIQAEIEARLNARLNEIIPSEFRSNTSVQSWNIDLAFAYRFYNESQVNPKGVATEFDLGPFVADAFVGVKIFGVNGNLDVNTNLGGEGSFSRSITLAQPLLGARFRYNFSHNLAALIQGSVAGFSTSSLGLSWQALGGLDWMFSGNTSLGVGWRFAYLGYETGSGRDAFGVNLYNNGPYLSVTFRF